MPYQPIKNLSNSLGKYDDELNNINKDITPPSPDLEELKKHEGSSNWAKLFLNFLGAAHNINSAPYTAPFDARVQNKREEIALKDKLKNDNLKNILAQKQTALAELPLRKVLQQNDAEEQPITTTQKGMLEAYRRQGKLGNNFDLSGVTNQTQYGSILKDLQSYNKLNSAENPQDKIRVGQTASGRPYTINLNNNKALPVDDSALYPDATKLKEKGFIDFPTLSRKDLPPDILMPDQQKQAINKSLPQLVDYYNKNYGKGYKEYQHNVGTLLTTLDEADRNNPRAASSLPALMARLFENIGGRLTNFDIKMQKDPLAKGYIDSLRSYLQGAMGAGTITKEQSKQIRKLTHDLTNLNEKYHQEALQEIRNRATQIVGSTLPFKDDAYLFGTDYVDRSTDGSIEQKDANHILNSQGNIDSL